MNCYDVPMNPSFEGPVFTNGDVFRSKIRSRPGQTQAGLASSCDLRPTVHLDSFQPDLDLLFRLFFRIDYYPFAVCKRLLFLRWDFCPRQSVVRHALTGYQCVLNFVCYAPLPFPCADVANCGDES